MDCIHFHNLNCAWFQYSTQRAVPWIANEVKIFVSAEQNNSILSPIIRCKELLTQNANCVILWYGQLRIMNIWYAGQVLSLFFLSFLWIVSTFGIHASTSFLTLAMLAVMMLIVFPAVSCADSLIPALFYTFHKSLHSRSAAWMRWCLWATTLSVASNIFFFIAFISRGSCPKVSWGLQLY